MTFEQTLITEDVVDDTIERYGLPPDADFICRQDAIDREINIYERTYD